MIVVAGEALVDLVTDPARHGAETSAVLGGAPYNVARACGRLGADVALAASISNDGYGRDLIDTLAADGVRVDLVVRTDAPTTIAHALVDAAGVARYRFDIDGTAAPALASIRVPPDTMALFTGGLGLVLEPMATAVEHAVGTVASTVLVMVDLNCRPAVIDDRARYAARVERIVAEADVVKASDEDLQFLDSSSTVIDAARRLRSFGPRVVLVTAGGSATTVVTSAGERVVPVDAVPIVDTIGAGDAFAAGFLTWWTTSARPSEDLADVDAVTDAVVAGHRVASVVVGRRGADPPWLSDLPPDWPPPRSVLHNRPRTAGSA